MKIYHSRGTASAGGMQLSTALYSFGQRKRAGIEYHMDEVHHLRWTVSAGGWMYGLLLPALDWPGPRGRSMRWYTPGSERRGNLEALDELDGIWGLPSCVWKDRYLEHKGTLDGIVRISSSGGFPETPTAKKPRIYNVEAPSSPAEIPIAKIPTAKKPRIYNVEAPSSPAEIPITKIPTAKKPRIYDVKVPSFRAGIQNGMQAPSKVASRGRRTHNSLTAHTAVYSDKHPQPHSEIVIPDPPSEAPIPPTDIQAPHHNASSWSGHWHRVHNLADKILARARSEMESDQEDSEDSDSDAEAMDSEDSEDTDDGLNPGQAKRKRIPEEDAQTGGGKRSKLSPTMQAPTSAAKMIMSRHVGF
ncbi:hypothetical protein C8R43DRAFT_1141939 [Mycena crocata]|nr:hypothetical protein C8R43DRAFT_1141939 [Mycena crocata]